MYMVWHVDKYKITFKLIISLNNEILWRIVVSSGLSRLGIFDVRSRYRAAARRLRNTVLIHKFAMDFDMGSGIGAGFLSSFGSLLR